MLPFESETGDRQRLALRAGLLDPVVAAPRGIGAVANFRYDAFEAELAGVLEHRLAVDLEGFAELDVGAGDDLLEFGLTLVQRQLPQIATVQIEEVERHQNDTGGLALELVLQHREIGGAVGGRYDDLAVDHRRRCLDVPGVVRDFLESMRPIVTAAGEYLDGFVRQVNLDPVAVELDFVDPAVSGRHLVDRRSQGRLDEARAEAP